MSDLVLSAMEQQAKSWRDEATRRRAISRADAIADTLDYCAGELTARLQDVRAVTEELTVEQFAHLESVTPQTVRTWIRDGRLAARPTARGYRIRVGERVAAVRRAS